MPGGLPHWALCAISRLFSIHFSHIQTFPQEARGQPAKELVCFSPRTFLISARVLFDPLSLSSFQHTTGEKFISPVKYTIAVTGLSCPLHTACIITVRQHTLCYHEKHQTVYMKGDCIRRGVLLCLRALNAEVGRS